MKRYQTRRKGNRLTPRKSPFGVYDHYKRDDKCSRLFLKCEKTRDVDKVVEIYGEYSVRFVWLDGWSFGFMDNHEKRDTSYFSKEITRFI